MLFKILAGNQAKGIYKNEMTRIETLYRCQYVQSENIYSLTIHADNNCTNRCKQLFTLKKKKVSSELETDENAKKLTIHEFDQALQPQNVQENYSQRVQYSQMDNGYKRKAWPHSQTNNQTPASIETIQYAHMNQELHS